MCNLIACHFILFIYFYSSSWKQESDFSLLPEWFCTTSEASMQGTSLTKIILKKKRRKEKKGNEMK